ncbi:MAG: isopentenyl-diphosphate delta-isomerase [Nitrospiraceae bacterium]|nr:isopentenyl-diphosphate delta-isomerase [Nitrospiraceae bacterium]
MEQIIIVDEDDNFIGEEDKEKCHEGGGILHRAFLAMVFNKKGEILLARRSAGKKLWPDYWDGTVASHLFKFENYEQASRRRLYEEIGLIAVNVKYLLKFRYQARYQDIGSENEICAVLSVEAESNMIFPNREEISETEFLHPDKIISRWSGNSQMYTPWLMLALEKMYSLNYFQVVQG